jgi:purine nucleosidase/pyrimidine-specific ribonucleoside hydrolase
MTNIALAIQRAPEIVDLVPEMIAIAGSFGFNQYAHMYATGDNPVSEWNVYVDPEAAKIVFHSGIPVMAIGVDIFSDPRVNYTAEHLAALRNSNNKESQYVLDLVKFVLNRSYQSYCVQIDTMAVAAAIDKSIFQTKRIHVDVETKGELTLGQTVTDVREHHRWDHIPQIDASYSADFSKYLDLLVDRITR